MRGISARQYETISGGMKKDNEMWQVVVTQKLDVRAFGDFAKFVQIAWLSFIGIDYAYRETVGKLFPHNFRDLVASLLMVASAAAYQRFHKVGVNVTLRDYEVSTLVHAPRYASRL